LDYGKAYNSGKTVKPKGNIQNLKPFKKGQTGNANGRPRKLPALDKIIAEVLGEESPTGITAAQQILKALRTKAKRGDVRAAELLMDRAYGKAKQTVDLNGNVNISDQPIVFE
jgi:hypothetical protein